MGDTIHVLRDLNGDGDALDVGEVVVWADSFGSDWPTGIAVGSQGTVYVADSGGGVWRLADTNGDGDALDVGENLPYTPAAGTLGVRMRRGCRRRPTGS